MQERATNEVRSAL